MTQDDAAFMLVGAAVTLLGMLAIVYVNVFVERR